MRVYKTIAKDGGVEVATRYAGTQADAKHDRDDLKELYSLKQKDVASEQVEIPTGKVELLAFINDLCKRFDEE